MKKNYIINGRTIKEAQKQLKKPSTYYIFDKNKKVIGKTKGFNRMDIIRYCIDNDIDININYIIKARTIKQARRLLKEKMND